MRIAFGGENPILGRCPIHLFNRQLPFFVFLWILAGTAGMDWRIALWDIRYLQQPEWEFEGHVPTTGRKLNRIHHPTFFSIVNGCTEGIVSRISSSQNHDVLTGGQSSHSLSIFKYNASTCSRGTAAGGAAVTRPLQATKRGTIVSRGKLPTDDYDGCDVGCIAVSTHNTTASGHCRDDTVIATSVDGGDILLLSPSASQCT